MRGWRILRFLFVDIEFSYIFYHSLNRANFYFSNSEDGEEVFFLDEDFRDILSLPCALKCVELSLLLGSFREKSFARGYLRI